MTTIIPSPELAALIQHRINELPTESFGTSRACKEELNALPICGNQIYLWAIRPDGTVLCMDHEAFSHPAEPENDLVVVYAVLLHGASRYPELEELVPDRPAGAQQCGACAGSGMTDDRETCQSCSGIGWFDTRHK